MTACAGGTQAIGDAMRWIRRGRADAVVAGGADSELYPMGLASFCLLGALSTRNGDPAAASRPFDAGRDGFVMGEGAGMVVLEEREHALRRGARIYAEAAGFGSACDAYRATDPHPDGTGAAFAMRRAMADARLDPSTRRLHQRARHLDAGQRSRRDRGPQAGVRRARRRASRSARRNR